MSELVSSRTRAEQPCEECRAYALQDSSPLYDATFSIFNRSYQSGNTANLIACWVEGTISLYRVTVTLTLAPDINHAQIMFTCMQ
jgi:hypothetical protein